ncbi:MerC domain-containing protein [Ferrimonas marina]|uniref:MerC mercury resistance protein n=1 Tax=Ferrimonas marina TaxID=299255 RepID=A0A1M5RH17_9GAMM|nr:MerC domain-containing protein [Ferrimonas marina]SHH25436.1 MerC mercury resistance protein [Ferrimonas marina]
MNQVGQALLDKMAIGVSVVCALHCAVMPIVLATFPALAILPMEDETFHKLLVLFVIPSSIIALLLGCRRHKDRWVLLGGVVGLLALVLTALFGHDLLGEMGEKVATVIAALVLASAHWRNFSLCRARACAHDA